MESSHLFSSTDIQEYEQNISVIISIAPTIIDQISREDTRALKSLQRMFEGLSRSTSAETSEMLSFAIGKLYEKLNEPEKAIDYFRKYLEGEEQSHRGYGFHHLSVNLRRLLRWDEAIEYSRRAVRIKGDHRPCSYQGLGINHMALGNFSQARKHYDKAIPDLLHDAEVFHHSSQNLVSLNRYSEALDHIKRSRSGKVNEIDVVAYQLTNCLIESICWLGLDRLDHYCSSLKSIKDTLSHLEPQKEVVDYFDFTWLPSLIPVNQINSLDPNESLLDIYSAIGLRDQRISISGLIDKLSVSIEMSCS